MADVVVVWVGGRAGWLDEADDPGWPGQAEGVTFVGGLLAQLAAGAGWVSLLSPAAICQG